MEYFGNAVVVILAIIYFLVSAALMCNSLERRLDAADCRSLYNVSSCEIIFVPNTEKDLIKKYGVGK